MLEPLNKLRFRQSQIVQGFDERHHHNFVRMQAFANTNETLQEGAYLKICFPLPSGEASDSRPMKQTAASGVLDAAALNAMSILEREIETAAHHAEVVLRAVDHVPAKIIDPADMRSKADFDATTELAN